MCTSLLEIGLKKIHVLILVFGIIKSSKWSTCIGLWTNGIGASLENFFRDHFETFVAENDMNIRGNVNIFMLQ